ncbi:glycosyltransferase family protein [Helicobacter suis]|uniref:Glycosyltransferase n=1 Tax=Helicobacter suis TaxID=104628 RepID=A0A6J4CZW8_9HELI|nr:hypothetical protein [Helicobacter suis]BCD51532.1 hypothetical protein NHP194022_12030 [Helicobacter suis]BCD70684.1 hypothetical protein SNTW_13290 [Helicobacter suis]
MVSESSLSHSPRPRRLALALMHLYPKAQFFILSPPPCDLSAHFIPFAPLLNSASRSLAKQEQLKTWVEQRNFTPLLWTPNRLEMLQKLKTLIQNLHRKHIQIKALFVEDLALLPAILEQIQNTAPLIVDLREFYPALINHHHFTAPLFAYICSHYLSKAHKTMSVNASIAKLYATTYPNFKLENNYTIYSTPFYANLSASPINPKCIRLIYHGLLAPERHSDNLLELAKGLKDLPLPYHLTIIGLSKHPTFLQDFKSRLKALQSQGLPVDFKQPLPLESIIPSTQDYDIGLLTLPNNSLNHLYALPNKFFEYIQSALCVLSTPLVEIKTLIENYKIGRVGADFTIQSLLKILYTLDLDQIMQAKIKAAQAAKLLCMQAQLPLLKRVVQDKL